jgi:hypothetical protein
MTAKSDCRSLRRGRARHGLHAFMTAASDAGYVDPRDKREDDGEEL